MELLIALARAGRTFAAILFMAAAAPACVARAADIDVATVADLRQGLASAAPGTTIRLAPGEHELSGPLVVPDHVVVTGSGQVVLDGDGRAAGWRDGPVSTLRIRGPWSGNAVELGHGAALRQLRIVETGAAEGGGVAQGEARNLIVVSSRRPGDRVEAALVECEVSTPQPFGTGPAGPLGRAVAVWTRNPPGDAPPDTGASARLAIERSIIRAPRSNALFAINFAPRGRVELYVQDSRLEGVLSAAGGTSLADRVTHAVTTIRSRNSEYVMAGAFDRFGWHLFGGSGVPHPQTATPPGADDNRLAMQSDGDRIAGYRIGILAAAGRRVGVLSGPSSGNRVDLDLRGLTVRTVGEGAADLRWYGAMIESPTAGGERPAPGENNLLVARITGSLGSGTRANDFADLSGPVGPDHRAAGGNRLVVEGSPEAFLRENHDLEPGPGTRFFRAGSDPH